MRKKIYLFFLFFILSIACSVAIAYLGGYDILRFALKAEIPTYQFYLCDFSAGFCSRVIIGAILGLFFDTISTAQINIFCNAAILLSLVLQSAITALMLLKAYEKKDIFIFALAFTFLLNPLTAAENMSACGLLDVFILIIFYIYVLFSDTCIAFVAAPLLVLLMNAIHYEAFFTLIPPVLVLLMYEAIYSTEKRRRITASVSFFLSGITWAGSFIYFVFFAKKFIRTTADAFYDNMAGRFSPGAFEKKQLEFLFDGDLLFRDYFDYYIFGDRRGIDCTKAADFFAEQMKYTFDNLNTVALKNNLIVLIPFLIVAAVVWIRCIRSAKAMQKLPYIAMLLLPLALVPELIMSTDIWRFTSATLIGQFISLFAFYTKKDSAVYTEITMLHPYIKRTLAAVSVFSTGYALHCFLLN